MLAGRYGLQPDGLQVIGSYTTVRSHFGLMGDMVELDETVFPFGKAWEIEIETSDPKGAEERVKALLDSNGIPFSHSQRNKFANMRARSIL
ncbi:hypothetical protein HK101_011860 [Irineochytrium annulatum]|nr:hypothetical protein HK101_011860 [Irineochytrium annulatum]